MTDQAFYKKLYSFESFTIQDNNVKIRIPNWTLLNMILYIIPCIIFAFPIFFVLMIIFYLNFLRDYNPLAVFLIGTICDAFINKFLLYMYKKCICTKEKNSTTELEISVCETYIDILYPHLILFLNTNAKRKEIRLKKKNIEKIEILDDSTISIIGYSEDKDFPEIKNKEKILVSSELEEDKEVIAKVIEVLNLFGYVNTK